MTILSLLTALLNKAGAKIGDLKAELEHIKEIAPDSAPLVDPLLAALEHDMILIDRAVQVAFGGKQSVGLPKGGKIRRRQRMTVVFGKPFCYTDIAVGENERENRSLIQLKIESELLALCKQAGLELRTSPSSSDSKTSDPTETGSGSRDPE